MDILATLKDSLDSEQLVPFNSDESNICLLAGAGSGKTRTLIHMVAKEILLGCPPSNIIAFTFTEKAAGELLARVHALVGSLDVDIDLNGMFIGTIHSWCYNHLQKLPAYANHMPLDELHLESLLVRIYDQISIAGSYDTKFPFGIDKFLADLEIYYNEQLDLPNVPEKIFNSLSRFLEFLDQNRLITFGAMINHAVNELERNGPVGGLQFLFVDEYQDVNPAQVVLIKKMIGPETKLRVVGDDLQCIYNWRGSDVSRILHFGDEFENGKTLRLTNNYRSAHEIVSISNSFAETISFKDSEKKMKATIKPNDSPVVALLESSDEEHQAREIRTIVERFADKGVNHEHIVILLRSVVNSGPPIFSELKKGDIPIFCPELNRATEFINYLLLPLFQWLVRSENEPANEVEEAEFEEAASDLYNVFRKWSLSDLDEETFWASIDNWQEHLDGKTNDAYNVRARLYELLDSTQIKIAPNDEELQLGLSISSQIIRSIEEIHRRRIEGLDRRTPRAILKEISIGLRRHSDKFGKSQPVHSSNSVTITTVHKAKGLEWPVVILPSVDKLLFPVRLRGHGTSFEDELASRYGTGIDDERRLFYVAMTRAKDRLVINSTARPSKFIDDLVGSGLSKCHLSDLVMFDFYAIDEDRLKPESSGPFHIGLSDLLMFMECPYQYMLRRIVGIQPAVGEELGYGQGLHEVIQRRLIDGSEWSNEKIISEVEQHVFLPLMSTFAEQKAKNSIIDRFMTLQGLGAFEGNLEPEVSVGAIYADAIITGIIDCIQVNSDGSKVLKDWKSNIHEELIPRYKDQISFYTSVLENSNEKVTSAELVDIGRSHKNGEIFSIDVSVEEYSLNSFVSRAMDAVSDLSLKEYSPKPEIITCSSCDVSKVCAMR